MPDFDPRSFIITSAVAGMLCSFIFFVLNRSFPKNIGGIAEWGWGCMTMVAGALLFSARDSVSPYLSVVCANTLVIGGILLMHVAVRRFAGLAPGYKNGACALLLIVAALIWQTVFADNYQGRVELVTSINMTLFAASAAVILRMKKTGFPERFTAGIFAVTALVSMARLAVAIFGHVTPDYRHDSSLVQHVYLATFSISLISLSLGFLLMVTKRLQERLEYAASHDDLTGAHTRATFFEVLERELDRSRRHRYPVSLLIMDIDDFKRINDRHGHPTGDEVIRHFSRLAADELRSHDVFCRYGGEEFAALLPSTGLDEASAVAERIRQRFCSFALEGLPSSTVSIGIASTSSGETAQAQLIESADQALYIAKNLGKNRVELAPGIGKASRPAQHPQHI